MKKSISSLVVEILGFRLKKNLTTLYNRRSNGRQKYATDFIFKCHIAMFVETLNVNFVCAIRINLFK